MADMLYPVGLKLTIKEIVKNAHQTCCVQKPKIFSSLLYETKKTSKYSHFRRYPFKSKHGLLENVKNQLNKRAKYYKKQNVCVCIHRGNIGLANTVHLYNF